MNKRLIIILCSAAALLTIPLIAMQFTDQVNWTASDFVIMGILLFGTGIVCELALRMLSHSRYKYVICGIVLLVFLLVWAELAVGVFGTPFAGS